MNPKYLELKKPDVLSYHFHGGKEGEECLNVNLPLERCESVFVHIDSDSTMYADLEERGLIIREITNREIQELVDNEMIVMKEGTGALDS